VLGRGAGSEGLPAVSTKDLLEKGAGDTGTTPSPHAMAGPRPGSDREVEPRLYPQELLCPRSAGAVVGVPSALQLPSMGTAVGPVQKGLLCWAGQGRWGVGLGWCEESVRVWAVL